MLADLRKEKIRRELAENGILSVRELTKRLKISPSTVRRDLIELEEEGEILRTRGAPAVGSMRWCWMQMPGPGLCTISNKKNELALKLLKW